LKLIKKINFFQILSKALLKRRNKQALNVQLHVRRKKKHLGGFSSTSRAA